MRADSPDVYDQLAWLVESGLPLPRGVHKLADEVRGPAGRQILQNVGDRLGRGETLAVSLGSHPAWFHRGLVGLIDAGERHGALADVLHDVAELARLRARLVTGIRDRIVYPLFAALFSLYVFVLLLWYTAPGFGDMYQEYSVELTQSPITALVLALSAVVVANFPLIVALLVALTLATGWLVSGGRHADRALSWLVDHLPGGGAFMAAMDYSRLSGALAVAFRHHVPLGNALVQASALVDTPVLRATIMEWAMQCQAGSTLRDAVERHPRVERMFALTLAHAPEAELGNALGKLAEEYRYRAERIQRRLGMLWTATCITIAGILVGLVIAGLFNPLIHIIDGLGE